ncbi:PR domain zinc finger protein 14 [Amphibalanus amphitrite]|uniref:PR domain zinc finger protein 14 n=1 Tax=Amphibalanus amphitrite TaxID=1232801 RepID=A0A6A4VSY6_AMPAM|nr:PR domain zinc finger protein 14 [Amphibalanus amphitrite]
MIRRTATQYVTCGQLSDTREHSAFACPLQHPHCWAQDSPGGCGADTLPACLRIDGSTVRAGPDGVAAYTLFGPLVGRPVRPEHLVEPVDLRHIWEVYDEGAFLDTSDPATSSWFRMLRPAARRSQRTLAVVTRQRHLFAVSTCHLAAGTELTYWQDDPGTAWSGKNMLKTRCGGCNMKFEHPLFYRRHCSLFHEPGTPLTVRKYYCKVCGEAVMGRQKLLRHALEKHNGAGAYQCQHCGKFFRRLSYLELHRNHGCAANPERTHPLCHLCGARFSQPQKLRVHIRREHSESDPSVSECRCARCGRLLGCRTALRRHLREVHPPPERASEAALRCSRCGKQFRNQCNLKVHMLTHSGVKPFRCSIAGCESAFTTKQCLQQHYGRVHQLRGGAVPPITRSVPYTVLGYSGQLPDPPPTTRRRLLCRGDRLRFSDFSVSRDLPEPSSGPRLMQDASRNFGSSQ